jgi:thiamine pyrophosphate-dependent acetolactate synthase large subunit-like protein
MTATTMVRTGAELVGETLATLGVRQVFGVVGSGNFVATAALVDAGATFYGARHESAAVSMADAYWRTTGEVAVCSVHQGPGLTNTLTALGEAAKSKVPLVVIAGATSAGSLRSNFYVDQAALVTAAGCVAEQIHRPESVVADTVRAYRRAVDEQRPVILNMPLDVQAATPDEHDAPRLLRPDIRVTPPDAVLEDLCRRLLVARHPLIIGGQGAWRSGARASLMQLADAVGARLATTAIAKGMFDASPWSVGIAGGFSTEAAAATLEQADLIVAAGASLTTWTTRGDTIFNDGDTVVQIDRDPTALGLNAHVNVPVVGDVDATARALLRRLTAGTAASEFRDVPVPVTDLSYAGEHASPAHPGQLTARLEQLLPADRTVVVDGGHFIGWPARGLSVPDPAGLVFTSAGFQSIGLGMGAAVGAAVGRPERTTILAVGDGGFLMSVSELETMVRLNLPVLVAVYNDAAYGAEVHHFRHHGSGLNLVSFPGTDIAAMARGAGAAASTVRSVADLDVVAGWLRDHDGPLVLDMKIDPTIVGPWAEQDFLGH